MTLKTQPKPSLAFRYNNIQHNDKWHKDTQPKDSLLNDTWHNDIQQIA
jgi:hypothetical protein